VPQDTPGFARSKKYRKMGWRGLGYARALVRRRGRPEENLLGHRGKGWRNFLTILDGRPHLGRGALGRG